MFWHCKTHTAKDTQWRMAPLFHSNNNIHIRFSSITVNQIHFTLTVNQIDFALTLICRSEHYVNSGRIVKTIQLNTTTNSLIIHMSLLLSGINSKRCTQQSTNIHSYRENSSHITSTTSYIKKLDYIKKRLKSKNKSKPFQDYLLLHICSILLAS